MQRNRTEKWQDGLSVDFSAESEKKNKIKQELLQQLRQRSAAEPNKEREYFSMHQTNRKRFKRSTLIAFAACLTVVLSATAYAVINYVNLGEYAQYIPNSRNASEEAARMEAPLPAELQGRLYDKDGNVIEKVGQMQDGIYDADGKAVITTLDESGAVVISSWDIERQKHAQKTTLFTRLEDAKPYLAFEAHSFPYVPAGYALEGYRIFNDEHGKPYQGTKYLEMNFYQNGNPDAYIYVQARLMDEETAFGSSCSDNIEKTSINGYEAILDGSNVDILIGDVMYMICANDLPQSETVKMAESLTK